MTDSSSKIINGPVDDDVSLYSVFGFSKERGRELAQQVRDHLNAGMSIFNILYFLQDVLAPNELVAIAFMLGSIDQGKSTYYETEHN